jgi:hypothetical protein
LADSFTDQSGSAIILSWRIDAEDTDHQIRAADPLDLL